MFRIGQFATLAGVTAKALRHYDRLGLFSPAWVDPATGYRVYTATQLPALRRIVALRDLGVPLSEVAGLIDGGEDLRDVLRRRRRELEAQRRRVERTLAALDITVAMPAAGPDVVVRTVGGERIATLRRTLRPDDGLDVLFDEVEAVVRDAGKRASRPPGAIVHHTDRAGRWDVEAWVPVTAAVTAGKVTTRHLPGGRMATALHRGDYESLHHTRDGLLEWIAGSGLRASGPERFVYLQFGADPGLRLPSPFLARRSEELLTEIQIPV
jgi:DNA-binding transcriptional MerR regulator